jgi:replication initiation and membrane attachment protein DnaB
LIGKQNSNRNIQVTLNKLLEKTEGASKMDNPETLATLSTEATGRRRTKQKAQFNTEN